MFQKKYTDQWISFILLLVLYFVFFQHLESFHIRNWDESMFAVNAYEMNHNNNFIVPYYKNMPDLWNSKPPLQIWAQILFIKIIGYTELAIRLPSALAGAFSALFLFRFFKKRASLIFALSVFFVFVTCGGVSTFHTSRTGDSDMLLSFLILCYTIEFYKWVIEGEKRSIFIFFIYLSLAFLTKSFAALLFAPGLIFLVFYFKKVKDLFTSKWFYMGFILFLIVSIGYVLLREHYNKGYINYILQNDIGRINNVIESHKEPFDFYFNNLFNYRFLWTIFILPGVYVMWLNKKTNSSALFLSTLFLSYFFIITYSVTKLEWYDLPLFPFLSVFSAFAITRFISSTNLNTKNAYILLSFIFLVPLYFSCKSSYKSEIPSEEKKLEILTEYAYQNIKNGSLNKTFFYTNEYDRGLYFYKYKLNRHNMDFKVVTSIDSLGINKTVIVAEDSLKIILLKNFELEVIDSLGSAIKVNIKSHK